MDRRTFLWQAALASAALTLTPSGLTAAPAARARSRVRAGGLTPILAFDDAVRLAAVRGLHPDVLRVLLEFRDLARPSYLLHADEAEIVGLLRQVRRGWSDRDDEEARRHRIRGDMMRQRLAVAASWLSHQGIHSTLGDGDVSVERIFYRDAAVLRALYASDPRPAGAASVPAAAPADLADLLRASHQRTFIRMHTLDPDPDDLDGWVVRLVRWHREIEPVAERYAEAYLRPDPDRLRRHVAAPNFYDHSDGLIRLARALHQGRPVSADALGPALQEAPSQSLYARSLARALHRLEAVSGFFGRDIDASTFRDRLAAA